MGNYKEIPVSKLIVDESIQPRFALSDEAIDRYVEWFEAGKKPPALKVWKDEENDSYLVVDGFHRREAALRARVKKLGCEILNADREDLLGLAYRFNRDHGVPLSLLERNTIIGRLRARGKIQEEIAQLMGLSQQGVSKILRSLLSSEVESRTKLAPDEQQILNRLILKGESQKDVAVRFNVSEATVSNYKSRWWSDVQEAYGNGGLKGEVAEKFGLEESEVEAILLDYEEDGKKTELLNFKPEEATLWPSFGIDKQFGRSHPGNIPALLVKNLLCRMTEPGNHILDPFAGGGVVLDVCHDMVGRTCDAFDLKPVRDDIKPWDILRGPPPISKEPDLIFLDPPYGPQKQGEYTKSESDLANLMVEDFCKAMERIFGYWNTGTLVCLMTVHTREGLGNYVPLPARMLESMERQGWKFVDWIVNQIGRAEGTSGLTVHRLQRANWWSRRDDLHILIGRK